MNSERWKQIDSLLQAALERPPEERHTFLRQACSGDEALEREVRSLLTSHQEAASFLESPAIQVAAQAIALDRSEQTSQPSVSLAGRTVSHYRVLEKLGHGGMGVVWKARDSRLNRFVALKFLPAAGMSDPARKRRFVQEAKAASALNHPNIITIHDVDQAEGAHFIAMEFVAGKTLDQLIGRKVPRLHEALKYAVEVADALAAAHAGGILHRDLKPANIMVNESGSVKVLDFGLAKLTEQADSVAGGQTLPEARTTGEGMIVGTVSYMSPEQDEGKKVDARTDIFSFGAVLYEMITGRRAFAGPSTASVLSAILRDEPKPVAELVPGVPRQLDRIVRRCLEKDPDRRYQHAGDLRIDLQQVKEELASAVPGVAEIRPAKLRVERRWCFAAIVASIAVSSTVGWWLHGRQPEAPPWKLIRLTSNAGLSGFPALSPDGKLVAYSSDQGLDGGSDLFVRQVAGGQPIRLTFDGTGNTTPDFSPDGTKIVFRSNRGGGGIYEIPAFGGEIRLLAPDGLHPKFSPDGTQVAYWVGAESPATAVPWSGSVWVVPEAGGQPRRVGSNFTTARYPIWSPDGKHLLFKGYTSAKAFDSRSIDWWLAPANGGDAVRTGAFDALAQAGLQPGAAYARTPVPDVPIPGCWSAAGNTVVFSIVSGDTLNLWEIGVSPRTGKVTGVPRRLTTGAGNEVNPCCASGGAVAFTNLETRREIWSLPFDFDRGSPKGTLERITQGPARRENPSFSKNGQFVAFVSDQSGPFNIWVRELKTGKETSVASSTLVQRFPVSNASGTRVAYSAYEKDKRVVYASAPGGPPEKLCEGCLRATDWSRDEKTLLVYGDSPFQINVLDVASRQQSPLLRHPSYNLLYGRFSPDNRWVSFTARIQPNRGRIAIAPVAGPKPIPESAWITIAETGADDYAIWSPDGKTLYFTTPRDGHSCLWGQRIEAISHQPAGEVFAVQHLHGRLSFGHGGWSLAGDRIGLALVEVFGNIWMMSRADAR